MQNFKKLEVWQKSHLLTLRRAAASIPANIAEGCGRGANAELRQFLHIAAGSANELIYFLMLFRDLGFLVPKHAETLDRAANDVKQMLTRLIQSVEATLGSALREGAAVVSRGLHFHRSTSSGAER